MGIDLDPLDDIFADEAVKNARAVGKFQPKSKFRPPRKDSAATSLSSSQAAQTINTAQGESSDPIRNGKSSENVASGLDVVSNDDGGWHASIEKSVTENADIFIGLEALGDFLPHTNTDMAEGTIHPSEEVALNAHNPENTGGPAPVLSSVGDSTHTRKVADVPTCHELSAAIDPVTAGEPIVSSSDGSGRMHDKELGREEMDIMDSINASELTTNSGHRTGKFQPKPKIQMHEEIFKATESLSCSLGSQSVPPEISYAEKDFSPTFQQDDVLDLSSLGFTHTLPTEASSELPLNEESINLMEMTQLDSGIPLESPPEIPAKLASRRAKMGSNKTHTASDPSQQQQKTSTSSQENETGRSLRPRKSKTNFCELVDEAEDEVRASEEFSEECPVSSAVEEETVNNEEFQMESDSQMKKVKRKSEKPVRKRKQATEASDKDADAKPKKFSHSTRRRRVDKVLLATPEDEIDYQKVPLRDLILLAEHKERELKKEEAAAGVTANKQSNGNSSGRYNQEETFTSEQNGEYNDGQGSPRIEDSTIYFNYHTHMDRTPSIRWSKQDTELFYEAVRQFGTDLSMIQQLFPDRTRRQVKLKYKKEERQHPLRLREALTNRTKDHSHFEKVIERLKQIAAEENQNPDNDESIDLTGNEVDEQTSNAGDEEAKDEHIEEEENENVANDFTEVQSPSKSDDIEDDLFIWSQYKSG
ncbi:Transcription factor TFIIIB component B'' [Sesamum alatum]|uniref:Transcription factor TFIIIB component B n=1 Tax=Sesamum alatum TaxID=300844 RepID=A0AAE2CSQ2_9LAMI|nr:Transcription factor TFIIIB component B'' [Sesamum alatum]